jgi:putative transcriptional regulator
MSSELYIRQGRAMDGKVANCIKEHRLRHGLTQGELAQAVAVSRQSINSIERGRYIPSLPLALKFAQVFDCSTDDLFQLQEEVRHG